jgi:hypothetical protein
MEDVANMSYDRVSFCAASYFFKLTPKPTRVAIDELQLHDLHIAEAAVPPVCQHIPSVSSKAEQEIDTNP